LIVTTFGVDAGLKMKDRDNRSIEFQIKVLSSGKSWVRTRIWKSTRTIGANSTFWMKSKWIRQKKEKTEVGSSGCKPHVGDWLDRLLATSPG
jgi:hypothetical protein